MLQSILTILVFLPILIASKGPWSYENTGQWVKDYRYCGGHLQSPINVQFNISQYDSRLKHISLQKQHYSGSLQLSNNGHTAELNLNKSYILKHVAPVSGNYIVEQLHFHWGHSNNNTDGSEHLLEAQAYPLEMHVVSYSYTFSNLKEASTNVRALAVIGAFFELNENSNEHLQPIIDGLKHIQQSGKPHSINNSFSLISLFGEAGIDRYYRYDGSLTTPPCYESVLWSVLQEPLKISAKQLSEFRNLHEDPQKPMKNTYRSIQSLGARKLFRSFYFKDIADEYEEHQSTPRSAGHYLSIYPKIFFLLISFVTIHSFYF